MSVEAGLRGTSREEQRALIAIHRTDYRGVGEEASCSANRIHLVGVVLDPDGACREGVPAKSLECPPGSLAEYQDARLCVGTILLAIHLHARASFQAGAQIVVARRMVKCQC